VSWSDLASGGDVSRGDIVSGAVASRTFTARSMTAAGLQDLLFLEVAIFSFLR
jgi:hypothetical protein